MMTLFENRIVLQKSLNSGLGFGYCEHYVSMYLKQSILFIRGFLIRGFAYSRFFSPIPFLSRISKKPLINIYPRIFGKNRE